ncbi:MAG: type II toxin-antitoxin system RelE/ParE family toxin [Gammaproteobacteria bacterium]|nr:type II toxin-antitoxin system RelE/ParE family toxin [Gammaproteobacteria bacterium]
MPTKSAEYRLSPKAREDMEAVWLYSLAKWGAEQTDRYTDDLTAAFELLACNPKSGTSSEHIRAGYRRHSVLRHVIYYRETAYGIEVIRVLHDRMLATRHL